MPFRRHTPGSLALLYTLAAVVAAIAAVAVVVALTLGLNVVRAQPSPEERRANLVVICREIESVKDDARDVLAKAGSLQRFRRTIGRRVFEPVDCQRRARELVP